MGTHKWPIDPLLQQHVNISNSLGSNLVTNGTFTGDASGWTVNEAAWTYNANAIDKDANGTGTVEQAITIAANKVYLISFVITGWTVGTVTVSLGGTSGTARGANGTFREYIETTNATGALIFTPTNTARFTLDTVTVQEVGASPADQVTIWVDDQGGTAGKATLYIRGENGTVIGIGGDGFTFGANDEDVTLAYTADTLTLAGGAIALPDGTTASPSLRFPSGSGGFYWDTTASLVSFAFNSALIFGYGATSALRIRPTSYIEWANSSTLETSDVFIIRDGAASLQMGEDSATPITQAFKGPDARAGTDTDTLGGRINWRTGLSTGNAVPAVQSLQGGAATVTSGTGAQTVVDRFIPNAFKVLTDGSAIAVLNVTVANNTMTGGKIVYCIEATDGTDYQSEIGEVFYATQNDGVAVVGAIAEANTQQAISAGGSTLTTDWAMTNANPAVISVNANTSLTPSTGYPRITFSIQNLGQQAVAIQ